MRDEDRFFFGLLLSVILSAVVYACVVLNEIAGKL